MLIKRLTKNNSHFFTYNTEILGGHDQNGDLQSNEYIETNDYRKSATVNEIAVEVGRYTFFLNQFVTKVWLELSVLKIKDNNKDLRIFL